MARTDGGEIVLGERVTDRLGQGSVESVRNDNSQFRVSLPAVGPIPEGSDKRRLALVIGGVCAIVSSATDREADGKIRLDATIHGEVAAAKVAAELGAEPKMRKHPGHRLHVTFCPDKDSYPPGDPVTLVMTIKNVGDKPVSFMDGGMQRGPRNNQFMFLAYRSGGWGRAVPDTGDPMNMGGMGGFKTLAPGETFTKKADLAKWFQFDKPDVYRVTGIFRISLTDPDNISREVWDELATGECSVHVAGLKAE
jgi:hypothetical protein